MNKTLDKIISILCIIGLIYIGIMFIQEIILNQKVIKAEQECLKFNGKYYCEVNK